jgi:hypothetical protein
MVRGNGLDGDAAALSPNSAVIRTHFDWLFRRCFAEYPDGLCEIAWAEAGRLEAIDNAESFPVTDAELDEATALVVALNAAGCNVYVGVNPRKPGSPERGRCNGVHVEIAFFQFVNVIDRIVWRRIGCAVARTRAALKLARWSRDKGRRRHRRLPCRLGDDRA